MFYFSETDTDEIVGDENEALTGAEEFSTKNDEKYTPRKTNGK
jgi:hypothetical protein